MYEYIWLTAKSLIHGDTQYVEGLYDQFVRFSVADFDAWIMYLTIILH